MLTGKPISMGTDPYLSSKLPAIAVLNNGQVLYFEEDVFVPRNGVSKFAGTRKIVAQVSGPGQQSGYVKVKILKSEGPNALPGGVFLERPLINLLKGRVISPGSYAAGGHIEGIKNGKRVVLDHAYEGGVSVGATHAGGGIQGTVGPDGRRIEVEDREVHLPPQAGSNPEKISFNGKEMTAKEIASTINQEHGGVPFKDGGETGTNQRPVKYNGGEIILTAPVYSSIKTYEFEGKKQTPRQILSQISEKNGGVAFEEGGEVRGCRVNGTKFNFCGESMADYDIADKLACGC